jgi:hypothetical protein
MGKDVQKRISGNESDCPAGHGDSTKEAAKVIGKKLKTTGIVVLFFLAAIGFLTCLMVADLFCQEIQELEVNDFSGGMVNSISNDLMQPNQALVFENFIVDDFGDIERRPGMPLFYPDAFTGGEYGGLFAYHSGLQSKMFSIRSLGLNYYGDDRDSLWSLTICNDAQSVCTALVYDGLFPGRYNPRIPYNISANHVYENLLVASSNSELLMYNFDSGWVYPVRPVGPGQINAVPIIGNGPLDGTYTYKCLAWDNVNDSASNLSAPSWPVKVYMGKMVLYNIGPVWDDNVATKIYLYRRKDDGKYLLLDSLAADDTGPITYVDSIATLAAADTTDYPWGFGAPIKENTMVPPGAIDVVSIDTCTTVLYGVGYWGFMNENCGSQCSDTQFVGYSIVFKDINGTISYMAPPVWVIVDTLVDSADQYEYTYKVSLGDIPVPQDDGIVKKYLLRAYSKPFSGLTLLEAPFGPECYANCDDFRSRPVIGGWSVLDSLEPDVTTYVDSLPPDTMLHWLYGAANYDTSWSTTNGFLCEPPDSQYWNWVDLGGFGYGTGQDSGWLYTVIVGGSPHNEDSVVVIPEESCTPSDSAISFRPSAITTHGTRVFAIGDNVNFSYLYYSDFGRPFNWPYDKFINIPGRQGDWLNNLRSMTTNALALFRQSSIDYLSGLSFYQYSIENVYEGSGAAAPQSLSSTRAGLYFLHYSGAYKFGQKNPISLPIENSIDSAKGNIITSFGAALFNEYWCSIPVDDSFPIQTYIYSETPPHWKCFPFGVYAAVRYDNDTTSQDFGNEKWIICRDNDSLYLWDETASDSLDDTVRVRAVYQSKYFLDKGEAREKIFYLDLKGTGSADSLIITILDLYGQRTAFCDTMSVDFTQNEKQRIAVNEIITNASVKITDIGYGDYTLSGYVLGFVPWDIGRMR